MIGLIASATAARPGQTWYVEGPFGNQFPILGGGFGFSICDGYSDSLCKQEKERQDEGAGKESHFGLWAFGVWLLGLSGFR